MRALQDPCVSDRSDGARRGGSQSLLRPAKLFPPVLGVSRSIADGSQREAGFPVRSCIAVPARSGRSGLRTAERLPRLPRVTPHGSSPGLLHSGCHFAKGQVRCNGPFTGAAPSGSFLGIRMRCGISLGRCGGCRSSCVCLLGESGFLRQASLLRCGLARFLSKPCLLR